MSIKSIVIIGSGNVATCLGLAFVKLGLTVKAVYSPTRANAAELAQKLHAVYCATLAELPNDADLYLLAVKDEVIEDVSSKLHVSGLVVHTSGSTAIDAIQQPRRGVFYALQTFNKESEIDFTVVPFLVEANEEQDSQALLGLAKAFSNKVVLASTAQRQALHLAAVFANNFTNHLMGLSKQIVEHHQLSYDLLKPLILQTAINATQNNPSEVQTGPAIRGDERTLLIHEKLLRENESWLKLYQQITRSIQTTHKQKKL